MPSFLRLGSWNIVMFVSYEQIKRAMTRAQQSWESPFWTLPSGQQAPSRHTCWHGSLGFARALLIMPGMLSPGIQSHEILLGDLVLDLGAEDSHLKFSTAWAPGPLIEYELKSMLELLLRANSTGSTGTYSSPSQASGSVFFSKAWEKKLFVKWIQDGNPKGLRGHVHQLQDL